MFVLGVFFGRGGGVPTWITVFFFFFSKTRWPRWLSEYNLHWCSGSRTVVSCAICGWVQIKVSICVALENQESLGWSVKDWDRRLQHGWRLGEGRPGIRRTEHWAQIPDTACHAPGFIQPLIKELWNLPRATQTNYSNKQQVTPPQHTHTSQGEN